MDSWKVLALLWLMLTVFLGTSQAHNYLVGGEDGWVPNPSESYNHWAERMRFLVNDSLVFKYKEGSDSVLLVTKEDYNNCNIQNPIKALKDGYSIFEFEHSGAFFFVSGNVCNCQAGQKLVAVVMAGRNSPCPPPPPPPSPVAETPRTTPLTPSRSPPPANATPGAESPANGAPQPSRNPLGPGTPMASPGGIPASSAPAFTGPASILALVGGVVVTLGSFVGFF